MQPLASQRPRRNCVPLARPVPKSVRQKARTKTAARQARANPAARHGFTLLELLIAIAIIGVLAGLILTAGYAVNTKARVTQVAVEIQDLSKSVMAFKAAHNIEPPSQITLYETSAGWNADPRSAGLIRQIWPQFDFNYSNYPGNQVDINGDGTIGGLPITISGAECLVFFLGGVPAINSPNGGGVPTGFSLNPVDPFNRAGSNRERFYDFSIDRLYIYPTPTNPPATPQQLAKRMNTFRDRMQTQQTPCFANFPADPSVSLQPYLYLSSYGGTGYDVLNELVPAPPGGTFQDVYRAAPSPFPPAPGLTLGPAWNSSSFQIISPGADGAYGNGGEYETANGATLLVGPRGSERDNVTNFSSGVLAP